MKTLEGLGFTPGGWKASIHAVGQSPAVISAGTAAGGTPTIASVIALISASADLIEGGDDMLKAELEAAVNKQLSDDPDPAAP